MELLGGLWFVAALWRFGPSLETVACMLLGAGLLAGSVIDFHHRLLPDTVTLGAIGLGFVMSVLPKSLVPAWPVDLLKSVVGAVLGGGLFLFVIQVFRLATGKEGMGKGDVKLMAGLGAVVGYPALHVVLLISTLSGIVYWAVLAALKKATREYPVPFGPFLSGGAMSVLLLWPWLSEKGAFLLF